MPADGIVEALNVVRDRGVCDPVTGKISPFDVLGFQRREEALGDGIVIAITWSAYAGDDVSATERWDCPPNRESFTLIHRRATQLNSITCNDSPPVEAVP